MVVIFRERERGYAPIENQIIALGQLAKVQTKFLHFATEQSTSVLERRVKTYMRSTMLTQQLSSLAFMQAYKKMRRSQEGLPLSGGYSVMVILMVVRLDADYDIVHQRSPFTGITCS